MCNQPTLPTPLDPPETSVHEGPFQADHPSDGHARGCKSFRHRLYEWHRKRVRAALVAMHASRNRRASYEACGSNAWVVQNAHNPERYSIRCDACSDRWCPACSRARSLIIRRNLEPLLSGHESRIITLTLAQDGEALRPRLDRLYASFTRLKKSSIWQENVQAGALFCEVKRNKTTGGWHPHLHIIAIGKYIPKHVLSEAWRTATGDSYITDIRAVRDPNHVARYVTKYLTKPCPNDIYRDNDVLTEAIRALHGRRMITTLGEWYGKPLLQNDHPDDWIPVMRWPDLLKQCRFGDPQALEIYRIIAKRDYVAEILAWPEEEAQLPPRPPPLNDAKAHNHGYDDYVSWIEASGK